MHNCYSKIKLDKPREHECYKFSNYMNDTNAHLIAGNIDFVQDILKYVKGKILMPKNT